MFVNVKTHVETLGCHLSSKLFRGTVNSLLGVADSQPHCEGVLTDREEVGFAGQLQTQQYAQPGEEKRYVRLCT